MSGMLALVTARGGSKGVPGKNLAPVAGRPLIAWTIRAALGSACVNRAVVSTDDDEIARVARQWGADAPFIRPAELAMDDSHHIPVMTHAVEWLESRENVHFAHILLLQPTSPLRTAEDIDRAYGLCLEKDADSVVSVYEAPSHPYWTKRIDANGRLEDFVTGSEDYPRRQSLPPAYALNGAIYVVKRDVLMEKQAIHTDRTYAYVMPPERSLDVDSPWDLHLADLILKDRRNDDAH